MSPWNSCAEILTPKVAALEGEALGSEGRALMNGIGALP
jgi:hypothetical protein